MHKLGAVAFHIDEWLDKKSRQQPLPRLAFSITFDDGWRDNFDHAFPKLKQQNAPATIFLVTRMTNSRSSFWPEQILKILTSRPIPTEQPEYQWLTPFLAEKEISNLPLSLEEADEVIAKLKTLPDETIYSHLQQVKTDAELGHQSIEKERVILNDSEISAMAQSGLVKFGAHTRHHYRLNRLVDRSHLKSEIVGSLEDLQNLGESVVPIFCYPNGDITKEGELLVKENFKAACTTRTGWNTAARLNPHELQRFNFHDGNSFNSIRFLGSLGRGIK